VPKRDILGHTHWKHASKSIMDYSFFFFFSHFRLRMFSEKECLENENGKWRIRIKKQKKTKVGNEIEISQQARTPPPTSLKHAVLNLITCAFASFPDLFINFYPEKP
jgi:hypothetical protein